MTPLKQTILDIKGDLGKKNGLRGFLVSYLYNPSFRLLLNHRIGKFFFKSNNYLLRQIGSYYKVRMITRRNCDISYNAKLGKGIRMPHPIGVVIGDGVIINDNVMIFQQVTFGSHGKKGEGMKYPVIESDVKIYAGAKIIGGVTIGKNAVIGANSVVNIDIPSGTTAVGIPCKII